MEVQLPMPNRSTGRRGCVLIVDQSEESRDVFRTVLERRGVEILEAPEARRGLELLRTSHPDVVVLDLEAESADDVLIRAAFDRELADQCAEMVVLGSLRHAGAPDSGHLVAKPYHYGPLIRKIEQLVEQTARARQAAGGAMIGL
jgi:CheY-like chemotaxis protein